VIVWWQRAPNSFHLSIPFLMVSQKRCLFLAARGCVPFEHIGRDIRHRDIHGANV